MQSMTTFVASTLGGEIVGTVSAEVMQERIGHLRGMAVDPSRQGAGMAQPLLVAAEQYLRGRGCARVTLDTTAPLTRAIRFYERQGYRPSGRVGTYFGMELFEYVKQL
jgi:putative acetyltransferase